MVSNGHNGGSASASADAIVVGAGLAGLVAAAELADAGRRVIIVEQEPRQSLGGQAFWSFGALFLVNSPEQRAAGIRDSRELAWQDWLGNAGFDRPEDAWPRRWAEAYVDFASGEKRSWLRQQGVRLLPYVGWAERGGSGAIGPGNSVPRFHVPWGTGPGLVEPFERRVLEHERSGRIELRFRHQVDALTLSAGAVNGVAGTVLAPDGCVRGAPSNRDAIGEFSFEAPVVIVAAGGIGGNHDLVRASWPERLGTPPRSMISGVPAHVDGRMIGISSDAGANIINPDRMWHYVEGVRNWDPIWPMHGIRIIPGPSSLWLDARGNRLPAPCFPGFDTLGTLERIMQSGHDHSWFLLTRRIIEKEFALSGSEQNPDLTGKDLIATIKGRISRDVPSPVRKFMDHGADFVIERDLRTLVDRMNALTDEPLVDFETVEREVLARDRETGHSFTKDSQVTAIRGARRYLPDRVSRVAGPHRLLDPEAGPLIAVRLHILTRKTLGGIETDLDARALGADGQPVGGLYAVGEAAGFGGGGMHGYRSLEGTFVGGCIFSGRTAGRAAARALA